MRDRSAYGHSGWALVLGLVLMLGHGCSLSHPRLPSGPSRSALQEGADTLILDRPALFRTPASTPSGSLDVVDLAFDVIRADLPVDTVRHSLKIWNHVDALGVDPERSARLLRNGVHVGPASAQSWPAIRTILLAAGARVRKDRMIVQHGLPLAIDVGNVGDGESIFTYGPNGRLTGKTFARGRKLVNVDYAVQPLLGGYMDVKIRLEIRNDRGVMTWNRQGGIIRQVPAYDQYVFPYLDVVFTLGPEAFLIIGPSEEASNEYVLGGQFLTTREGGKRFETVLIVVPQPYQTQRPTG